MQEDVAQVTLRCSPNTFSLGHAHDKVRGSGHERQYPRGENHFMSDQDVKMSDAELNVLRSMTHTTWKFYLGVACLSAVVLWGLFGYVQQLRHGLIVTGLRDQISWGVYIINFVFFISISIAGTLISAVLRLVNAEWRRPITRMAETITLVALFVAAPLVAIDMGRPDRMLYLFRYGRIQSPILWDALSVSSYLVGSLIYFFVPLVPDMALLADRPELPAWRRRMYSFLSTGWKGTPQQVHLLEKSITIMAVAVLPLAISTHTVLGWIFSMTLRPGWNSSIFGPYFVIGAIYGGCACVVLSMCVLRRAFHLEDYLKTNHFRNVGFLLLTFCLLYIYFNLSEYLTIGYKAESAEKTLMQSLLSGEDAWLFWSVNILGILGPFFLLATVLIWKRYRDFLIKGVTLASGLVVVGAWAKRYLIVVPTLQSPFLPPGQGLPWEWVHYRPSLVEWSITAAAFSAFMLIYMVFSKLFPIVSIWETREQEEPMKEIAEQRAERAFSSVRQQPYMPPPLSVVLIAAILISAVSARAADSPAAKSPTKTAVMSLEAEEMPPSDAATASPAGDPKASHRVYYFALQTLSPLFWGGKSAAREENPQVRPLAIVAKLHDEGGAPLAYQAVGFALETSFGTLLDLGKVPTDGEGKARLVVKDRRCGTYPFQAVFSGDQTFKVSYAQARVDFGPCPSPALPAAGVLITPYPTAPITMVSVLYFGTIWSMFFYAFGYLFFWRVMRRAGQTQTESRLLEGRER
jgi:Ni/Fe-hydrogenase subunit HybB-like protein